MDPVNVPPGEPTGPRNDPLWAVGLDWLREVSEALEAATAALTSLGESDPSDESAAEVDRRAFNRRAAGDELARAEFRIWKVRRLLRGESANVLEDATGQGRR